MERDELKKGHKVVLCEENNDGMKKSDEYFSYIDENNINDYINDENGNHDDNKYIHSDDNKYIHSDDNKYIHSDDNKYIHSDDNKYIHSDDNNHVNNCSHFSYVKDMLECDEEKKDVGFMISDKERYEFLKYADYFFHEYKDNVHIYREIKFVLKTNNPSLLCLLKNICLLGHIIYFYEDLYEQKLLTSKDINNIENILYKNEDTVSNNYTIIYNCFLFLLEIIKLSIHTGVQKFAYYQMIRNKKLIQTISYNNFNYNPNKIKNKEHFFIKKDNEALFIKDMITLHIVNMLNQTHKHIRLYALKLSILFISHISKSNHIINHIMNIIFQQINFEEYIHALVLFLKLVPYLSHDVLYHIIKKLYKSLIKKKDECSNVHSLFMHIKKGGMENENPQKNIHHEKVSPYNVENHNVDGEKGIQVGLQKEDDGNKEEKNEKHISDKNEEYISAQETKNPKEENISHMYNYLDIFKDLKCYNNNNYYEDMYFSKKNKKNTYINKMIYIINDHFSFTKCLYFAMIGSKLNELYPYVSYYLFKKLWNIINKIFYIPYNQCDENKIVHLLDVLFYNTTLLSFTNIFLLNLQIIILKFLLNISQTYIMKKRYITFYSIRALLYLIKKKKLFICMDYYIYQDKIMSNQAYPFNCMNHFLYMSTFQYSDILHILSVILFNNNNNNINYCNDNNINDCNDNNINCNDNNINDCNDNNINYCNDNNNNYYYYYNCNTLSIYFFIKLIYKFFKVIQRGTAPNIFNIHNNNIYRKKIKNVLNIKKNKHKYNIMNHKVFKDTNKNMHKHSYTNFNFSYFDLNINKFLTLFKNVQDECIQKKDSSKVKHIKKKKVDDIKDETLKEFIKNDNKDDINKKDLIINNNKNQPFYNQNEHEETGKFNFLITIDDANNTTNKQKHADIFFHNFICTAKNKHTNNNINIKNLNITLDIIRKKKTKRKKKKKKNKKKNKTNKIKKKYIYKIKYCNPYKNKNNSIIHKLISKMEKREQTKKKNKKKYHTNQKNIGKTKKNKSSKKIRNQHDEKKINQIINHNIDDHNGYQDIDDHNDDHNDYQNVDDHNDYQNVDDHNDYQNVDDHNDYQDIDDHNNYQDTDDHNNYNNITSSYTTSSSSCIYSSSSNLYNEQDYDEENEKEKEMESTNFIKDTQQNCIISNNNSYDNNSFNSDALHNEINTFSHSSDINKNIMSNINVGSDEISEISFSKNSIFNEDTNNFLFINNDKQNKCTNKSTDKNTNKSTNKSTNKNTNKSTNKIYNTHYISYAFHFLKQNKINLGNLIDEHKLYYHNYNENNLFTHFKNEFFKKGKEKNSDIPNIIVLKQIMFIKILFFLYKHNNLLIIKLYILKTLSILSKHLIFEEDIENFIRIFNYFVTHFLKQNDFTNTQTSTLLKHDNNNNVHTHSTELLKKQKYTNHIFQNIYKQNEKETLYSNNSYNSDHTSYLGSVIMSSDSSTQEQKKNKTNKKNYLNNFVNYLLNKNHMLILEETNSSFYNKNVLKNFIRIYITDIIHKLLKYKNQIILNSILYIFTSNQIIPFFNLFHIFNKEGIEQILKEPFFYLTVEKKYINEKEKEREKEREKANQDEHININHTNNNLFEITKGDHKNEDKKSINKYPISYHHSYLNILNKHFFQSFQFDNISFNNVKALFYFSFFNFINHKDSMIIFRKKTLTFLNILNDIYFFKTNKYVFYREKYREKLFCVDKTNDFACTSQANNLTHAGKMNELLCTSQVNKKLQYNERVGVLSYNERINLKIESMNGHKYINIEDDSIDKKKKIDIKYDIKNNDIKNNDTKVMISKVMISKVMIVSISCVSYKSVDDGSTVHYVSDDDKESVDDDFSISSISNKSFKHRIIKSYDNLYNEDMSTNENIQMTCDIHECSYIYMYKIGLYCIISGYYNYGYKIFTKLYMMVNNRDIKLWLECLLNYCKFYYLKKNQQKQSTYLYVRKKSDKNNMYYIKNNRDEFYHNHNDFVNHCNYNIGYINPSKCLEKAQECIKQIISYKENFFHVFLFLQIKKNIYQAIENLIILINDIKYEINYTVKYFTYNIEEYINFLKSIFVYILLLSNFKYEFSRLSKRILYIYMVLIKTLFVICIFMKNKIIPYLFLNSSFLLNTLMDDNYTSGDQQNESTSEDDDDGNTNKSTCKYNNVYHKDHYNEYIYNQDGNIINLKKKNTKFNLFIWGDDYTGYNFTRLYLERKKERIIRKKFFSKELKDVDGKSFQEIFEYIINLWKVSGQHFFFYDHIHNLNEMYYNLFKDNIINKKKILNFLKIYLLILNKINYPTPPRFLSSRAFPCVVSRAYIYKSNFGKMEYEVESVKCIGHLENAQAHVIKHFYYCNIKLVLRNKIIRNINVKAKGVSVLYTFHIQIENEDLKNFYIFMIPLDKDKQILGQAKPTDFFIKYV
ncbi:hypothetical protein PFFVO_01992 [Plasmodium falciparum Vietnam Oak-Knoll (FVO)]|nr:hypothetical protein PFFVO_01992 [Plasmodium falciparum Vietnam Oak-Knoll (FVO)]